MENCIFCKIVRKEIPAEIVYEDDFSIGFLDINPVNEGHVLIIPKEHHAYITETPDEIVSKLFITSKNLMPKLKEALGAFLIVVTVVGTDVPHFHIHLIPRFENDGLKNFWPTRKYSSDERKKEIGEKIRKAIHA